MHMLEIINLRKSFGEKQVLSGLVLSVPAHSVFGFVGRNGAGKTTAMKAVLGLLKADEGEIYVAGEKVVYGQTPTNRYVGYLPDVPEFYTFMTPREYLKLCGESLGMERGDIEARSRELLSLVGLSEENRRMKGFSRGMKQRLGIAQALLARPKLLLCDEPTSALDPLGRKEILDILLSCREQTTVLFSTHILSDVERICTEAAFLEKGKIVLQGKVADLKNIHSREEVLVETVKGADMEKLLRRFQDACVTGEDKGVFAGGKDRMFEILSFIAEQKMPVRRVERIEPSLETLFVEVMAK